MNPWTPDRSWTRRRLLIAAAGAAVGGCDRVRGSSAAITPATELRVTFQGNDVRCLIHEAVGTPLRAIGGPVRTIVLLHGANTDASQWTAIGLRDVADHLVQTAACGPFIAIAPDIADHSRAPAMVLEALLPAMSARFGSAAPFGISGISLAGAAAFQAAATTPSAFASVGLHSPAISSSAPVGEDGWDAWLDVGDADSLAVGATRLAARMRQAGTAIEEHHWPGGHDRAYWRAHLGQYLLFHARVARDAARFEPSAT